ncbi:hypothetical protein [Chryseobacterium elymi]|uniref:hypothetical protein n=1 Tax=Chryseobacterium elymi TaxID=395936 RepID=UPI001300BD68|nr:hypothetical protein [Chryseobacterium elymi]
MKKIRKNSFPKFVLLCGVLIFFSIFHLDLPVFSLDEVLMFQKFLAVSRVCP